VKLVVVFFFMSTWKWTYVAPTTLRELRKSQRRYPGNHEPRGARWYADLFMNCYLPYAAFRFLLIPAAFLPLGSDAALCVLINTLIAEWITNANSFLLILPNHTGGDVTRFNRHPANKADFYLHQITGSVNYVTGGDRIDIMHGWTNYQIEHHLFPNLTMLGYRKAQPEVKALCARYGITYIQENVGRRFLKMTRVLIGVDSMQVQPGRPLDGALVRTSV